MRSTKGDTAISDSGFCVRMLDTDMDIVLRSGQAGVCWQLLLQPVFSEWLMSLHMRFKKLFLVFRVWIIVMAHKDLTLKWSP